MRQTNLSFQHLLRSTIFPYAFFSSLWIALSDRALSAIAPNIEILTRLQTFKGLLFALVSSLFLYGLVRPKWQSLKESYQLLQAVLEGTRTPIFLKDRDGRYVLVNSTGAELIGMSVGDVLGKDDIELLLPENARQLQAHDRQVMVSGQSQTYEEVLEIEGVRRTFLVTKSPFYDSQGNVAGTVGVSREISDRKAAEEKLRQSQAQLNAIVTNSTDGILILDGRGKIRFANPAAVQLFGSTQEKLVGFSLGIPTGTTTEIDLIDRSGAFKIGEMRVALAEWQGESAYLVALRDITHRKQTELALQQLNQHLEARVEERTTELTAVNLELKGTLEELQHTEEELRQQNQELENARHILEAQRQRYLDLFNFAPDGYLITNSSGIIQEANEAIALMFERDRHFLVGKPLAFFISPPERLAFRTLLTQIDGNTQTYEFLLTLPYQPGDTFPVVVRMRTITDSAGRAIGFRWLIRDITDRKQAEAQIQASLAEKEVLLREIHHRVKNNLQIITSLFTLQSLSVREPRLLEILRNCKHRVEAMATIHESLYQAENLARVDFREYIQKLANSLFFVYHNPSNPIELTLDVAPVTLNLETANPCGLILNELLTNALKYAFPDERSGKIGISLQPIEEQKFALVVWDNGIGFPEGLDFRKVPSLGMQLLGDLSRQLKGTVELDRSQGTRFTVTFSERPYRQRF
jgi:PAS domain S-box-containing protein